MPVLIKEAVIERAVTEHAKKLGCITRKLNGLGNRAWPDRMFLFRGRVMFIEFKRPGLKVTLLQSHFHNQLANAGFEVYVVDNRASGVMLIDSFVQGPRYS